MSAPQGPDVPALRREARVAGVVLASAPLLAVGAIAVLDPGFLAYFASTLLGKVAIAWLVGSYAVGIVGVVRGRRG